MSKEINTSPNHELKITAEKMNLHPAKVSACESNDLECIITDKEPLGSNLHIQRARNRVFEFWYNAIESFLTTKGKITSMLQCFPEKLRIVQTVVNIKDKEQLRVKMAEALQSDKEVGLRTCYKTSKKRLGNTPWVMGISSMEQLEAFFGERELSSVRLWQQPNFKDKNGKRINQTYDEWCKEKDLGLQEIIVMENPKGLGEETLKKDHFVFRVGLFPKNTMHIELRDFTDQLRGVEESVKRFQLIEISIKIPKSHYGTFSTSDIYVFPGASYLPGITRKDKGLEKLIEKEGIIWNSDEGQNLAKRLFSEITRQTIDDILDFIFKEGCSNPNNHIYYLLYALSEFGLEAAEFQGRHRGIKDSGWIKLYGLRGTREK